MNVISYINGDEQITDFPATTARPLASFVQLCNDQLAGPDGYLSPEDSLLVLDLAWLTVGTASPTDSVGDTVIHAWVSKLLVSPPWVSFATRKAPPRKWFLTSPSCIAGLSPVPRRRLPYGTVQLAPHVRSAPRWSRAPSGMRSGRPTSRPRSFTPMIGAPWTPSPAMRCARTDWPTWMAAPPRSWVSPAMPSDRGVVSPV